jgi:hypothetical protein
MTVVEKADALLLCLAKEYPVPATQIPKVWEQAYSTYRKLSEHWKFGVSPSQLSEWHALKFLSIAGVANVEELRWLAKEYLVDGMLVSYANAGASVSIPPKGWQRIEQLRSGGVESRTGFVAMNFHEDFNVLFDEVLRPGITDAGYEAHRVDKKESNEKIDDEIIAGIRACRFMVADASRHRPNVYYEAGYAKGLGRDVIWMVEQCDEDDVHFDTRQYPFIPWKRDDLPAARKALQMRIEATIGRGPVTR